MSLSSEPDRRAFRVRDQHVQFYIDAQLAGYSQREFADTATGRMPGTFGLLISI